MEVDHELWKNHVNNIFKVSLGVAGIMCASFVVDALKTSKKKTKKAKRKRIKKNKRSKAENILHKKSNHSPSVNKEPGSPRKISVSPRRKVSFKQADEEVKFSNEGQFLISKSKLRTRIAARKISFDTKMIEEDSAVEPLKVLFTGGPCAGKTTGITELATTLRNLGYNVIVVPEAASLIFSSGATIEIENYTVTEAVEFQKNLMEVQIALENRFVRLAKIRKDPEIKSAVIFDRGLLDGSAYIDSEQWEAVMDEVGLTENDMFKRYDIVIHMVTAADGADKYYQLENNEARTEGKKLAIDVDRKLQRAYASHPNHIVIGNYDVSSFEEKIKMVENYILQTLKVVPINNYHRKYLVRDPKGELFDFLAKNHGVANFTLKDIFMGISDDKNKVTYIRSRVDKGGKFSFVLGERVYKGDGVRSGTKKNMLWRDFQALAKVYEEAPKLERERLITYFPNQKLIVDKLEIQGVKFLQVIIQIRKLKGHIKNYSSILPKVKNNVVYEISDDPNFRLEAMASDNWEMYDKTKKELIDYEKFVKAMESTEEVMSEENSKQISPDEEVADENQDKKSETELTKE